VVAIRDLEFGGGCHRKYAYLAVDAATMEDESFSQKSVDEESETGVTFDQMFRVNLSIDA